MSELSAIISKALTKKFQQKKSYLSMFVNLDTGPEDWFRVEILEALLNIKGIEILATNQKFEPLSGRPDFVIKHNDYNHIIELKTLPTDRNYTTGYQRFCAGKTNKADFDGLVNGEVDLIIYMHWASNKDFCITQGKLEERYSVICGVEEKIDFDNGELTISIWQKNV